MSRRHALWWALVAMTSLQCAGFAHAEVSSHLLGRWIVVQLGGKPAYMPYKLRLFQHASVFPDDRQYGIADFELEAYGRESCFLAVAGFTIVGPAAFQKQYPQVPYMLCTRIENGPALDFCAEKVEDRQCIEHAMEDEKYLDTLFDSVALKWRKARGRLTIYSTAGDGAEVVLAPDPEWPRS
jgi:hypothetical protein